jgi:hypothetical protein
VVNLQQRVVNILTKPKDEWPVIAEESTDVASLYKEYIAPLAAIPQVCSFIGMATVGVSLPFVGHIRVGFAAGLRSLIVGYVMALVGAFIAALIIEKLAPRFKSAGSTVDALKLVAYASTPGWIAGVLSLVPMLGALGILAGLYGIYLFYLGLTPVMKTPSDQVLPYMIVSAICVIVVMFVVSMITGLMAPMPHI